MNFRTLSQLGGSGGQPLIKAGSTDSIEFRRIKEKATGSQVKVSADGDDILVRGNNLDGDNGAVTVVDGLVTVIKTLGSGIWGTFTWTGGVGDSQMMLRFENGMLVESSGGNSSTGSGTQAAPYTKVLEIS